MTAAQKWPGGVSVIEVRAQGTRGVSACLDSPDDERFTAHPVGRVVRVEASADREGRKSKHSGVRRRETARRETRVGPARWLEKGRGRSRCAWPRAAAVELPRRTNLDTVRRRWRGAERPAEEKRRRREWCGSWTGGGAAPQVEDESPERSRKTERRRNPMPGRKARPRLRRPARGRVETSLPSGGAGPPKNGGGCPRGPGP